MGRSVGLADYKVVVIVGRPRLFSVPSLGVQPCKLPFKEGPRNVGDRQPPPVRLGRGHFLNDRRFRRHMERQLFHHVKGSLFQIDVTPAQPQNLGTAHTVQAAQHNRHFPFRPGHALQKGAYLFGRVGVGGLVALAKLG